MAIKFPIELDVNGAEKGRQDIGKIGRELDNVGKKADDVTDSLKEMLKQTLAFAGISLGAAGLKEFGNKIIDVRKEMQGYNIALTTLLGNQDKANAMFNELKEFAVTTPLMLKDLASGAQTMLGFNIEAEKVVPTLKAIGDISMGDSQKFQSLTLAFSQMSATGKLMGQDLLQMINAGFNPLTEISRKTGKSISDLKEEMSAGAISAEMVADAFMSATQEGGKFHGMINEMGKGLAGQINTLKGALEDMFNSLGEQSEGVIVGAVSVTTELIKNYETVGRVLTTLIATYGTYKAALIATEAVEAIQVLGMKDAVKYMWLNVSATKAGTVAQTAFNAAVKANPYVAVATILVTVVGLMWSFADHTNYAATAQERLNKANETFRKQQEDQANKIKDLIGVIQDQSATDNQRLQAYTELGVRCEALTKKYSMEQLAVMSLTGAYKELNKIQEQDRMENLAEDTNRKIRVYSDLKRVRSGKQRHASADTQQFIKETGLAAMSYEEVMTLLKGQIDSQRETVDNYNKNQTKTREKGLTYQQEAKLIYDDWKEAKRTYEQLLNSRTATKERVKQAQAEMERFDKEYETLTGRKASDTSKAGGKDTKQQNESLQRLADLDAEQDKERERRAKDQELAIAAARIEGMAEGREKVLEQAEYDYKVEKEKIRRQEEDLLAQREKDAREMWEAQNKKDGATWSSSGARQAFLDNGGGELTEDDRRYFEALRQAAVQARERAIAEQNSLEQDAMNDYLQKYGDMQQKRTAIISSYNKQIEKATTEGEKLALQKGLREALSDLDMEAFKSDINWEAIFGDLGKYTKKQLDSLQSQLRTFKKSDEYAKATVENKQVIDTALSQIEANIRDKGGVFGNLGEALNKLAAAELELASAEQDLRRATTETGKDAARKRIKAAQQGKDDAEADVRNASQTAQSKISSLASTITQLGTASEITFSDLGGLAGQIGNMFGEMGQKIGGWIGAIFTLADMIARDGIEGLVQNVGKLVGQALGGLFGIDTEENTHYYEEQKEMHAKYIQLIQGVIKEQEELLRRQSGIDALQTYNETKANYQKIQQTISADLKNWLNSGASKGFGGIGSSNSNGYEMLGGLGKKNRDILAQMLGLGDSWDNSNRRGLELADVTADQIRDIQNLEGVWERLPDEVIDYYNSILEADQAIKDLTDTLNESAAQITFDTLASDFKSALENMDGSAADFSKNLEAYFNKAVVNGLVNDKYQKALQDWYGDASDGTGFAGAMAKGVENLTQTEIDRLRAEYNAIVDSARAETDALRDRLGITDNQTISATQRSVASMSEETAGELNGRFTAIQISNQEISDSMTEGISELRGMHEGISETNRLLNDINIAILGISGQVGQLYADMVKGQNASVEKTEELISTINSKL